MGVDRTASGQPSGPTSPLPDCNFLRLLANSPPAFKAYLGCMDALARGQLTPRQRELLALCIAEINGARYCLSAHCDSARKIGLDAEEIDWARRATARDLPTRAMLRFAQSVTLQRGELSELDFKALRLAGLTDALIAEIITHIALNIFTNYFNRVACTDIDFPALTLAAGPPAMT